AAADLADDLARRLCVGGVMKDPAGRLKALPKAVDESLQLVEIGAAAGFEVRLAGLEVVDLEGTVAAVAELDGRFGRRLLEAGGHDPEPRRQLGNRCQGSLATAAVGRVGLAYQHVELEESQRRHSVFGEWLEPLSQPAKVAAFGSVEIAAEPRIRVESFKVFSELARVIEPARSETGRVGAHRGQQAPDLVAQLALYALAVLETAAGPVAALEQALQQLSGGVPEVRPVEAGGGFQVGDARARGPAGVDAAVHVGCGQPGAPGRVEPVIVLVGVLAARVQPGPRVAQDPVGGGGGPVQGLALGGRGP